jgi:hypothetical protein
VAARVRFQAARKAMLFTIPNEPITTSLIRDLLYGISVLVVLTLVGQRSILATGLAD